MNDDDDADCIERFLDVDLYCIVCSLFDDINVCLTVCKRHCGFSLSLFFSFWLKICRLNISIVPFLLVQSHCNMRMMSTVCSGEGEREKERDKLCIDKNVTE